MNKQRALAVILIVICSLLTDFASIAHAADTEEHYGIASHYSSRFHGKKTASGDRYDMHAFTAAHRTLPLLSWAKITNLKNNRSVVVQVNDRGGFHGKRKIDLSHAAAEELGIYGLGEVKITPL
jgi:rare lipoprotein A